MKDNWIYSKSNDNRARFLLGEKGIKTLICIGVNPSTAEPDKLDNTLKNVKRYSSDLGYDSWLMLNIYPQRATLPSKLHTEINLDYHKENLKNIEQVLQNGNYDIWAAWGTMIKKRKYLFSCLCDIVGLTKKYSIDWYTIGKRSKDGHPHHPLYLKKYLKLDAFEIDNYVKNKKTALNSG